MTCCRSCAGRCDILADFGPQPVCNRFLAGPGELEFRQPLAMVQCGDCGLVQLEKPMAAAEVRPRFDWISYREPEGHLDRLAEVLATLPGLSKDSRFMALTAKDDSLLDRLARLGFSSRYRLDLRSDLGIADARSGLETIQERLTAEAAQSIARARGAADVLIVRHVLEHAYDTQAFAAALKALLSPGARLVLEVPDNKRCFEKADVGAVWEEHVLYFTRATFESFFPRAGLRLERLDVYPYSMEDSLVGIAKADAPSHPPVRELAEELRRARAFAASFPAAKEKFRSLLSAHRPERVALFGAGHRSAAFINLLSLSDRIGFVIDDDANKKGLLMPGSRLPIRGSSELAARGVELCLLNMSPESEERVVAKNHAFLEAGGRFVSVFPDSPYALEATGRPRS